jgi:hypothetical protein
MVTSNADLIAADGQCSLREAVTAARDNAPYQGCPAGAAAGTDTILLDAQAYVLSLPGAGEAGNLTGDLDTGVQALRIAGRGAGVTAVDANGLDRAFDVVEGASLALEDLTVRNGRGPSGDPGEEGGAVRSNGSLSILRAAFVANAGGIGSSGAVVGGGGAGGAISSRQQGGVPTSLTVVDSSFIGNRAGDGGDRGPSGGNGGVGGRGGAIEAQGGTAAISGTTFSGNLAGDGGDGVAGAMTQGPGGEGGDGGAIYAAFGTLAITTSTLAANRAGAGGLTNGSPATPARGGGGGAWFVDSSAISASAEYSTFAGNLRGPASFADAANGAVGGRVASSILADAAPACQNFTAGPLRNVALPGDPSCAGPRLDGDPRLGPLAANGGPTLTLAPGPGSAAIDALAGAACPATDQRGLPRPRLGGCDAGAVEVQPPPASAAAAPRTSSAAAKARRLSSLRLTPAAFRAARAGGSIGALTKALQQRKPVGTTVRYRLDGVARVTFTITRPAAGRRKGRRCVRPAAARPGARRCVRTVRLKGSFAHQGVAGQNSFRFTGRLRRKALALGPYRLVAKLPRPATGRAALAGKGFRIVR